MDQLCFVSGNLYSPRLFATNFYGLTTRQRPSHGYQSFPRPPRCQFETPNESSESKDIPKLRNGDGKKPAGSGKNLAFVGADTLGISFTCDAGGCGERITKSVRRRSYEKGTVLIQCPRCKKHHIIADNYGLYTAMTGGRKNIEEIASATGTSFTRVGGDTFERALGMLCSLLLFLLLSHD